MEAYGDRRAIVLGFREHDCVLGFVLLVIRGWPFAWLRGLALNDLQMDACKRLEGFRE